MSTVKRQVDITISFDINRSLIVIAIMAGSNTSVDILLLVSQPRKHIFCPSRQRLGAIYPRFRALISLKVHQYTRKALPASEIKDQSYGSCIFGTEGKNAERMV